MEWNFDQVKNNNITIDQSTIITLQDNRDLYEMFLL
jgi:hypothetical protein